MIHWCVTQRAVDLFGDAQAPGVELVRRSGRAPATASGSTVAGDDLGAALEGGVDERFERVCGRHGLIGHQRQNSTMRRAASTQSSMPGHQRDADVAAARVHAVRVARQIPARQHRHVRGREQLARERSSSPPGTRAQR